MNTNFISWKSCHRISIDLPQCASNEHVYLHQQMHQCRIPPLSFRLRAVRQHINYMVNAYEYTFKLCVVLQHTFDPIGVRVLFSLPVRSHTCIPIIYCTKNKINLERNCGTTFSLNRHSIDKIIKKHVQIQWPYMFRPLHGVRYFIVYQFIEF